MDSRGTRPNIHIYLFSPKVPSCPSCHRTLSIYIRTYIYTYTYIHRTLCYILVGLWGFWTCIPCPRSNCTFWNFLMLCFHCVDHSVLSPVGTDSSTAQLSLMLCTSQASRSVMRKPHPSVSSYPNHVSEEAPRLLPCKFSTLSRWVSSGESSWIQQAICLLLFRMVKW